MRFLLSLSVAYHILEPLPWPGGGNMVGEEKVTSVLKILSKEEMMIFSS